MTRQELTDLLGDVAADATPLDPAVVENAVGLARRRRRRKLLAAPAAAVALAAVLAVAAPLSTAPHGVQVAGGRSGPALAKQLEDYSFLMADAKQAPPGRAAAVIVYYVLDTPRVVVVGADGNSYRSVLDDGGRSPEFDATLLSPDGTLLAFSHPAGVELQDLRTGSVRHIALPGASRGTRVLAFSPDGSALVAGVPTGPPGDGSNNASGVDESYFAVPQLIDVRTGARRALGSKVAVSAAFSPDGKFIAVSHPGELRIHSRDGTLLRSQSIIGEIAGPNAWSPDGRFIATYPEPASTATPETIRFAAADPAVTREVPPPVTVKDYQAMLGWRSSDAIAVVKLRGSNNDVVEVGLTDGRGRRITTAPGQVETIAASLLPTLRTAPAGDADFGPWPGWARVLVGVVSTVVLVLGVLLAILVRWVRRRSRRAPAAQPIGH